MLPSNPQTTRAMLETSSQPATAPRLLITHFLHLNTLLAIRVQCRRQLTPPNKQNTILPDRSPLRSRRIQLGSMSTIITEPLPITITIVNPQGAQIFGVWRRRTSTIATKAILTCITRDVMLRQPLKACRACKRLRPLRINSAKWHSNETFISNEASIMAGHRRRLRNGVTNWLIQYDNPKSGHSYN